MIVTAASSGPLTIAAYSVSSICAPAPGGRAVDATTRATMTSRNLEYTHGGRRPRRVHRVLRRAGDDRRFPGAPRGGGARRRDAGGHREGARAERVVPQHDDDPGQGTRLRVQPGADRHGVVDRHRWRRVAVDRPDHRAARQLVGIVVRVVINAVAIYLAAGVVPGIALRGEAIWPALLAAFVLAALNAIVRPLLVLITLPLTLVTLGLFLLV